MKVVQAFGYQDRGSRAFRRRSTTSWQATASALPSTAAMTNPATRCVNSLVYAGSRYGTGAYACYPRRLPHRRTASTSTALSYANQYTKPFNDIGSGVVTELQNALACAGRIFELLEEPAEVPEEKKEVGKAAGEVNIEHVSFSYDKSKKLIEDFNFESKPGMRVAIVGPTGCGKTTFINLLMRFYDTDKGDILVDGQAHQECDPPFPQKQLRYGAPGHLDQERHRP